MGKCPDSRACPGGRDHTATDLFCSKCGSKKPVQGGQSQCKKPGPKKPGGTSKKRRRVNHEDKVGEEILVKQPDGKWREAKIVALFRSTDANSKVQVASVTVQYDDDEIVARVPVNKTAVPTT